MEGPTTGIGWLDHVILWALVLTVLGGGWGVYLKHIRPFFQRLDEFSEDWRGRPARPGVDAVPGVMESLALNRRDVALARAAAEHLKAEVQQIKHEVKPNGGSSLKDAVDRTELSVRDVSKRLDEHIEQSAHILAAGKDTENELRSAITGLANALPVVARSTPAEEDQ